MLVGFGLEELGKRTEIFATYLYLLSVPVAIKSKQEWVQRRSQAQIRFSFSFPTGSCCTAAPCPDLAGSNWARNYTIGCQFSLDSQRHDVFFHLTITDLWELPLARKYSLDQKFIGFVFENKLSLVKDAILKLESQSATRLT